MGGQLAKLFLRGSLMNQTAKFLTTEQRIDCQKLMNKAWEEPLLQNAKNEFCIVLSKTIGNEYRTIDIGMQDARITFWRTAVLVLYHESKKCPRCINYHCTTKTKLDKCDNLLVNWCDEMPKNKKRPHGKVSPKVVDAMWLKSWISDKELKPSDLRIVNYIISKNGTASICPTCYKNGRFRLLTNYQKCNTDLIYTWEPRRDISEELRYKCCGEEWDGYDKRSACKACGKTVKGKHIKMKKFFQTVLFNYMKQIFRENKPPSIKKTIEEYEPADKVFINMIKDLLNKNKITYDLVEHTETYIINTEIGLWPQRLVIQIQGLLKEFTAYGINAKFDDFANQIIITPLFDLDDKHYVKMISQPKIKKIFINFMSIDAPKNGSDDDDGNMQDFYNFKTNNTDHMEKKLIDELDTLDVLRGRLPQSAQGVLDLIVNTPPEYIERFNTNKIYKSHIAKFLGKSVNEVEEIFNNMRIQHSALSQ